jgi:predicted small lipoprotein YifL
MKICAIIVAVCLAAALGGCGQKGSLYLPDAAPKPVPAVPASKPTTAPAGTAAPASAPSPVSPATPTTPATPAADDPATRRKTPTLPDPESSQ